MCKVFNPDSLDLDFACKILILLNNNLQSILSTQLSRTMSAAQNAWTLYCPSSNYRACVKLAAAFGLLHFTGNQRSKSILHDVPRLDSFEILPVSALTFVIDEGDRGSRRLLVFRFAETGCSAKSN
jgi:hypothetical protein